MTLCFGAMSLNQLTLDRSIQTFKRSVERCIISPKLSTVNVRKRNVRFGKPNVFVFRYRTFGFRQFGSFGFHFFRTNTFNLFGLLFKLIILNLSSINFNHQISGFNVMCAFRPSFKVLPAG